MAPKRNLATVLEELHVVSCLIFGTLMFYRCDPAGLLQESLGPEGPERLL